MQQHVKRLGLDAQEVDIVVRAFANLKDLRLACLKNGKMQPEASTVRVAQGVNQRKGLFDFIDVGEGKEKADHKIRGKLTVGCRR